jgi:D-glycero-D-manno-heptose 1,7-bisphosphate phosphatase
VTSEDRFRILPGVLDAIARLNRAGVRVLVLSNQRGIALGLMTIAVLERIHRLLQTQLSGHAAKVDKFYVCPHDKNSCSCRKPLPEMFWQASRDFPDVRAENSFMIDDSLSDIEFGSSLGMKTIWIEGDSRNRNTGWEKAANLADYCVPSLPEAVDLLLQSSRDSS